MMQRILREAEGGSRFRQAATDIIRASLSNNTNNNKTKTPVEVTASMIEVYIDTDIDLY